MLTKHTAKEQQAAKQKEVREMRKGVCVWGGQDKCEEGLLSMVSPEGRVGGNWNLKRLNDVAFLKSD